MFRGYSLIEIYRVNYSGSYLPEIQANALFLFNGQWSMVNGQDENCYIR